MSTPPPFPIGIRVSCAAGTGSVRFDGTTSFAPGRWVGLELDLPNGKNNGTVLDVYYFTAKPHHGLFLRPSLVVPLGDDGGSPTQSSTSTTPNKRLSASNSPSKRPSSASSPNVVAKTKSPSIRRTSSFATSTAARPSTAPHANILATTLEPLTASTASVTSSSSNTSTPPIPKPSPALAPPSAVVAQPPQEPTSPSQHEQDDLKTKLKYLQDRRKTDQVTIRNLETELKETKQAIKQHSTLVDELATLQSQLQLANQRNSDYEKKYHEAEARAAELSDVVESVTMDKEFADSQAEDLGLQLNQAKSRIEELQLNLQILEEERELIGSDAPENSASVQNQSDRLRDALFQLKQDRDSMESRLTQEVKELRHQLTTKTEMEVRLKESLNRLQSSEVLVDELRDQVDDLSTSEHMVNRLTEQILNLETRLDQQQQHIDDLEVLRELSEQLEVTHMENERDLISSVDERDRTIRDLQAALTHNQDRLADHEYVIAQFRDKCNMLMNENQALRAATATSPNDPDVASEFPIDQQQYLSLHAKLQAYARDAHSKSMDLELRQIDVQQALDQLELVRAYMPPGIFKTEMDAIQSVLRTRRIVAKTDLLLSNKYLEIHDDATMTDNTTMRHFDTLEILGLRHELGWMNRSTKAMAAYMETCPSAVFVDAVVKTGNDLAVIEKHLDHLVSHVKQNYAAVRPATFSAELKRFNRMLDVNLNQLITSPGAETSPRVSRLAQLIVLHGIHDTGELAAMAFHALVHFSADSNLVSGVQSLTLHLANIRTACVRQLEPSLIQAKGPFVLDDAILGFVFTSVKQIGNYLMDIVHQCQPQSTGEKEGDRPDMDELLARVAGDYFDNPSANPIQTMTRLVQKINAELARLVESTDSAEESLIAVNENAAPWVVRGGQMQMNYSTAESQPSYQDNLSEMQAKLYTVTQELYSKDNQVQELILRCQLMESRKSQHLEPSGAPPGQVELVQELKQQIEKYQDEVSNLNMLVDQLRSEAGRLERENHQLNVQFTSPKVKAHEISLPLSVIDETSTLVAQNRDTPTGEWQVLVSAMIHLRAQIARLKAAKMLHQLNQWDAFYYTATKKTALPHLYADDHQEAPTTPGGLLDRAKRAEKATFEARSLLRKAAELASMPKMVSVAPFDASRTSAWKPLAKRPRIQLHKDRIEARLLVRKAQFLKASLDVRVASPYKPDKAAAGPFATVTIPFIEGMPVPSGRPVDCYVESLSQIRGIFV